jgi:hypothetical protein
MTTLSNSTTIRTQAGDHEPVTVDLELNMNLFDELPVRVKEKLRYVAWDVSALKLHRAHTYGVSETEMLDAISTLTDQLTAMQLAQTKLECEEAEQRLSAQNQARSSRYSTA